MQRTVYPIPALVLATLLACDSTDDEGPAATASDGGTATSGGESSGDAPATTSGGDSGESTSGEGTSGEGTQIPSTQEPLLAEATMALNMSCGVDLIATIDWPSFEANYGAGPASPTAYDQQEAVNYCLGIVETIEFYCRDDAAVAANFAALGLVQIHCYWADELPVDPPPEVDTRENMIMEITADNIQTWGMNWWSANIEDQVWGWVTNL